MTVLEVGPAAVRRLPHGDDLAEPPLVCAALAGIDDTTVLLDECPVSVEHLWRHILSASSDMPCEAITLVHPSWWPARRVTRLAEWASGAAATVATQPRSTPARLGTTAVLIELGTDVVAICRGFATPDVLAGPADPASIVARIMATSSPSRVLIDAPHGVPGAGDLAQILRTMLSDNGIPTELHRIEDSVPAALPPDTRSAAPRRHPQRPAAIAAFAVAVTILLAVVFVTARPDEAPIGRTVNLVEGRIVVQIPADWRLRRVTAGPGSHRVELTSVTDPSDALHITQSYAPGQTHDTVAHVLDEAIRHEAPGVFTDFDPDGRRAGRQVLTYQETRSGREIRWFVLLDGPTRISIGCQRGHGSPEAIGPVCDRAIASARQINGTERRP
ncbi:type VII secretion-associated protein [Mycobacterium sp. M26]|uniref:type VII secretion-associated protein n=1 Tax=Mycobacterium sp. M26 TaxID=1762962 RepID=UPI00073E6939|nr:type VII secretion-associated protein [Mycobacterium sp. M26]